MASQPNQYRRSNQEYLIKSIGQNARDAREAWEFSTELDPIIDEDLSHFTGLLRNEQFRLTH